MRAQPFACAWLIESEDRAPRLVLEANRDHWNTARGPRLERVVFRNDLTPAEALEACMSSEGEVDIVSEVAAADAPRVEACEHARLVVCDANRVLAGILNRGSDAPLADRRVRRALNLCVDQERIVQEAFGGHANVLAAMTPEWCGGFPTGAQPYPRDAPRARSLLTEAGWPEGRPLRLATPSALAGIARLLKEEIESAVPLAVELIVVPDDCLLAGAQALVEKKIPLPWDVLVHVWFDLSSEAPPAVVHREFLGADGAFRAGPELPEFDALYAEMVAQTDGARLAEVAERIDRLTFDEALLLFLCAPKALYAVNKHVSFGPYRTTFELAECEVSPAHWSRR
jgi:ABC-type transport system substrate-binding protein